MFVQCKIILEGTLIVSNLKMINKMSTFPPGRISADAHEWSCFLAFVFSCFHSLRIVCFFPFSEFRLQNKHNQLASCYYFIKITCNNKCYSQITMGVGDYSKRQLKTIRFPISRAPI